MVETTRRPPTAPLPRIQFLPLTLALLVSSSSAEIVRFMPAQGGEVEVWRITRDPTVRNHINYHNKQAWSPDGRYLLLLKYDRPGGRRDPDLQLLDLRTETIRTIDRGDRPRWANRHNWLFYLRSRPENGAPWDRGTEVMWLDVESGKLTRIGHGVGETKWVDHQDRWLYGVQMPEGNVHINGEGLETKGRGVRLPIREDARLEVLQWEGGYGYGSLYVNPSHPMIISRDHAYKQFLYVTPDNGGLPYVARVHSDHDLEGRNATRPFPIFVSSHFSWSGDGEWFLCGDGLMRGRRWNEPLPGNIHFLANLRAGDISPCGRSGRWICSSAAYEYIAVADLWSGDARRTLRWALSYLHDSEVYSYSHGSALHDNDAKGSPDGTKIVFASNYDLKDGPFTEIAAPATEDRIPVSSTAGFPPAGRLSLPNEVLGYERKTATSFEGLSRRLYGTRSANLVPGTAITSFESRLIPEAIRRTLPLAPEFQRPKFPEPDSPLAWQKQTDVYVAVVRKPDPPFLREFEGIVELIPGENHYECAGYLLYRDGQKITAELIQPGAVVPLPEAGVYSARAVEWSGLESPPSSPVRIEGRANLQVRPDKPSDFAWTTERWLIADQMVSREVAAEANDAVRELVHRVDGLIRREWLVLGKIASRHDLNREHQPIRRQFYRDGRLQRRDLHTADGALVSTEHFDESGYITESVEYRNGVEYRHWWYERGEPIRHARGRFRPERPDSYALYERDGERWVQRKELIELQQARLLPAAKPPAPKVDPRLPRAPARN